MNHTGLNRGFATQRALDVKVVTRRSVRKTRQQELEAKLLSIQKDYAELHASIFEAAQIHRRLCAPRLVRYGNFEIASEIFAVRHLPGDFFTIKEVKTGVILALGDICGKGLAAGMWTTHLVGLIGAHAAVSAAPEEIITGVNCDVCEMPSLVPIASLFIAHLDPLSGRLDYCSAGHPPAMLLRANGEMELLTDGGLLLGVIPDAAYVRGSVDLRVRDSLLIYSDGLIDSTNKAEEEFGYARLERQFRRAQTDSSDRAVFSVLGAVQDFAAARAPVDDMSLAILSRQPQLH